MRPGGSDVNDSYSPRTVVTVALVSLIAGFVLVFGSGTLALRGSQRGAPSEIETEPLPQPRPVSPSVSAGDAAAPETPTPGPTPGAPPTPEGGADASAPAQGSGRVAAVGASGISRCWNAGSPAALAAANCDRLAGLDQHFQSRAAELGACTRGRGRLSLIVDLRFSTAIVRSWGGPTSTVPNAGDVVACVRRVTQPIPLATMAHAHDRYIAVVPIEW